MLGIHWVPLALPLVSATTRTILPPSSFDDQSSLEKYFNYNYRWGPTHNGDSYMKPDHVKAEDGILTLTANHTDQTIWVGPHDNAKGYNWIAGTANSKTQFNVPEGGGYNVSVDVKVPGLTTGMWPAFWLEPSGNWDQEMDLAEFRFGKIMMNTYDHYTGSYGRWDSYTADFPNPDVFHTVFCQVEDAGNGDATLTFYIDGKYQTAQSCTGCRSETMYLIIDFQIGGDGGQIPDGLESASFSLRNLNIVEYGPSIEPATTSSSSTTSTSVRSKTSSTSSSELSTSAPSSTSTSTSAGSSTSSQAVISSSSVVAPTSTLTSSTASISTGLSSPSKSVTPSSSAVTSTIGPLSPTINSESLSPSSSNSKFVTPSSKSFTSVVPSPLPSLTSPYNVHSLRSSTGLSVPVSTTVSTRLSHSGFFNTTSLLSDTSTASSVTSTSLTSSESESGLGSLGAQTSATVTGLSTTTSTYLDTLGSGVSPIPTDTSKTSVFFTSTAESTQPTGPGSGSGTPASGSRLPAPITANTGNSPSYSTVIGSGKTLGGSSTTTISYLDTSGSRVSPLLTETSTKSRSFTSTAETSFSSTQPTGPVSGSGTPASESGISAPITANTGNSPFYSTVTGPGTTLATGTELLTYYTTYCPSPTTFTYGSSTYKVSAPTTLILPGTASAQAKTEAYTETSQNTDTSFSASSGPSSTSASRIAPFFSSETSLAVANAAEKSGPFAGTCTLGALAVVLLLL